MTIQLRLLGPFAALAGATDLTPVFSQPKRLAFVTWLALNRPAGLHRRETVCALLWPESSDQNARGALRQLLWVLRRELGDRAFITEGDLLGLNPETVSSDAGTVFDALDAGDDARAVALYKGELLPGLHLGEGEAFERWFELRREELRSGVARAAWRLVDRSEAAGDVSEARRLAQAAFALGADDEAGLRRLVTLDAKAGDRATALRTYDAFTRRLRDDWNAEPEAQTVALMERIRTGDLNGGGSLVSAAPVNTPARLEATSRSTVVEAPADVSFGGKKRSRLRAAGALVLLGVTGVVAAVTLRADRVDASLVSGRVLVVPFENRTGDPALATLGMSAADWVIQGLQRSGLVEVVDVGTAYLTTHDLPNRDPGAMPGLRQLARGSRAGLVVVGAVSKLGDSVEYTARVADVRTGRVLRVLDPIRSPMRDPAPALDELRSRIAGAIAAETEIPLAPLVRGDRPPRIEAYREFVAGLLPFTKGAYTEAIPRFRMAWELDSSFTTATMWLAYAFWNADQGDSGDAITKRLAETPHLLTPLVRAELEAFVLEDSGATVEAVIAARRRAAKLSPASENEWKLAERLHSRAGRHREAADILLALDPDRNWVSRWVKYFETLTRALHMAGDFRGEIAVAERADRIHPTGAFGPDFAYAALGDLDALRAHAERVLTDPRSVGVIVLPAGELEAHGHLEEAIQYLEWGEPRQRERADRLGTTEERAAHLTLLAFLAAYKNDPRRAADARTALEPFLTGNRGFVGQDQTGTIARAFGYITAVCTEGDTARIARLPAPLAPPWWPLELAQIAACQGNLDEALRQLHLEGHDVYIHKLPAFRPLRNDPRYQAWLHPEG